MAEETRNTFRYRLLRYTPNLIRDEWVNIGVLLEEVNGREGHAATPRRAVRVIEDAAEMSRVRRLHPGADEDLLRALPAEFDARLRVSPSDVDVYIEKLDQTLSTTLQFSPQKALLAEDFDIELERLFRDHVAAPVGVRGGLIANTRAWIRSRLNDVFRKHRILDKLERSLRVEGFTQPGDPMRLDYGYRYNGTRGFIQGVALNRDHPSQAKVLAYTVDCIRKQAANSEFTAVTESEPLADNPRHQFVARLFREQRIEIVPLSQMDRFADALRPRLQ
jgi:Protein of unknown function (DUF3037)